ncbi:M24 family metallopeptidase [Streptomyces sp. NPDC050619]|uniref:M24 family metallopeptidase n=1 Tax=Streptomyces sp. NPDC050619 TaxID=3157214 RepID=UPI00342C3B65
MTTAVTAELPAELRGFRQVQRLAYACAEAVAARLEPGVTEREAARMQRVWLRERGVRDWFHLPFAWFGDRTAFGRLDGAPLQRHTEGVRQGYANRHRACPFGVIAHKLDRVKQRRWSPHVFGFGAQSLKGLAADALHGHREGCSPLWSRYRFSDHPPQPGLWAVEPHLGFRGTGAKFEEILVVTDSRDPEQSAFWLDDDVPWGSPRASSFERGGVRRWAEDK